MFDSIQQFFADYPTVEFLLRIFLATVCGWCIGLERTKRSKEAGVRTHCIIACASAAIMIISQFGFAGTAVEGGGFIAGIRGADSARVAAQVVSGISFLGAGVIFRNGSAVKGLTTAAGIWATAAVGLAFGSGMYIVGVFVTALILLVQLVLHRFSVGNDAFRIGEIRITMVDTPEVREALKEKQTQFGIIVTNIRVTANENNTTELILSVRFKDEIPYTEVVDFMDAHTEIKSISI